MAQAHPTSVMKRGILGLLVCLLAVPALSQTIYRADQSPMDAITLTAAQKKQMKRVDAKYGPPYDALLKKERSGADVMDKLDAVNREYTKGLLAIMTDKQKLDYLHAVYEHMMSFLDSHPDVKPEDVFIWGGAYAISPKVDHLPSGFPG